MPVPYDDKILRPDTRVDLSGNNVPQLRLAMKSFPYFFGKLIHMSAFGDYQASLNENQVEWYDKIQRHQVSVLNKSRQEGMTTMLTTLVLWKALYHDDSRIMVIGDRLRATESFMNDVKFLYEECPSHLKRGVYEYNRRKIMFDNTSFIHGAAFTPDAVRGMAVTWIVFENPEYARGNFDDLYMSLVPSLVTNPDAKMLVPWEFSRPLPDCLVVANRRLTLEAL
jgi:hypothetical protein